MPRERKGDEVRFLFPALTDRGDLFRTYGAGLVGRDFCWDEREVESSDRSNGEECVTGENKFLQICPGPADGRFVAAS